MSLVAAVAELGSLGGITRMATFTQSGGARLDNFNASYPFATLSGDPDALHLSCIGRDYHFPRISIRRLSRHRGLFAVGLRIEHTQD
jgi:hypothetical protein